MGVAALQQDPFISPGHPQDGGYHSNSIIAVSIVCEQVPHSFLFRDEDVLFLAVAGELGAALFSMSTK